LQFVSSQLLNGQKAAPKRLKDGMKIIQMQLLVLSIKIIISNLFNKEPERRGNRVQKNFRNSLQTKKDNDQTKQSG